MSLCNKAASSTAYSRHLRDVAMGYRTRTSFRTWALGRHLSQQYHINEEEAHLERWGQGWGWWWDDGHLWIPHSLYLSESFHRKKLKFRWLHSSKWMNRRLEDERVKWYWEDKGFKLLRHFTIRPWASPGLNCVPHLYEMLIIVSSNHKEHSRV